MFSIFTNIFNNKSCCFSQADLELIIPFSLKDDHKQNTQFKTECVRPSAT